MNAYDAILSRRSTRTYKPNPVESEKIDKIVTAGRYAPSGGNNQTNHFFVITDPDVLQKLIDLVVGGFRKMEADENTYPSLKKAILRSKEGGYVFCYNAPVLIAVANKKEYGNNMADVACAIENMMIEANELDLGTCYINQLKWLNEDPDLVSYLTGLGMKEDERMYGSIIVGYPATSDGLPVRQPLERKGNEVTYL